MSKNGFLIAIEGTEPSATFIGEQLAKKLRRKGCNSVFGVQPEVGLFRNYFRDVNEGNVAEAVSVVANDLDVALQFESFEPDKEALCEARRVVSDFNDGKKISKIDLQLLSFFERKFHLRSVVGNLVNSGCFVVLKGYELERFAAGLYSGISFEELLLMRNIVLAQDRIRPDVTILICPRVGNMNDLAIHYEIAINRLQNTHNYGFVVRVDETRGERVMFRDVLRRLSRFIPAFL